MRSERSHGRLSIDCTSVTQNSRRAVKTKIKSSPRSDANYSASSGISLSERNAPGSRQRPPEKRRRKNLSYENEGKADGSGRAHEKENPPTFYAVQPQGSIRASSPRQL